MASVKNKEAMSISKPGEPFYKRHIVPILISCFSFLLYANTTRNDYNLDDELVTNKHKYTSQGFSAIPEIFTSPYYSDESGYSYDYRPIVHLSFAIEHQFFGESAHVSHFFNVLLFAALCALLYMLLKALLPVPDLLLIIAIGLFAAHPIHTEVVASIKNRDELLMFLFSALSLYALTKWLYSNYILAVGASVVLFTLALLSKSTAIPFAVLIPVSILFFRTVSFGKYFVLSLTLAFMSALLINNTQLLFKLRIGVLLLSGSVIAYALFTIKNGISIPKLSLKPLVRYAQLNNSKTSSVDTRLPRGMHLFLLIAFYIVLAIGVFALFTNMLWLMYISLMLAMIYIVFSPYRLNVWILIPAFIALLLLIQKYDEKSKVISIVSLVGLCMLVAYTIGSRRRFFIALLALFSLHWLINIHSPYYLLGILFFSGIFFSGELRQRLLLGASVIFLALFIAVVALKSGFDVSPIIFCLLSVTGLLVLYKGYSSNYLFLGSLVLLFASAIYSSNRYVEDKVSTYNVFDRSDNYSRPINLADSYVKLQQVNVQGPVSVSVDRPLNYIETPVPLSAPIKDRLLLALDIFLRYAKLLVVPHPLLAYYGYKIIEPVQSVTVAVVISVLLHLSLFIVAVVNVKRQPVIAWSIFFYLTFMLTLGNIFISIPGGMGERYLLVPSLAFCTLVAWLVVKCAEYLNKVRGVEIRAAVKWIVIPVVVLYSGITIYRNSLWKDGLTLYMHDIEYAQESAQLHNLLANRLMVLSFDTTDLNEQTELRKKALYHFQETVRIYPAMFNAAYDIARVYATLNMADSAVAAYKYASSLDTNFYNIQLSIADIYYAQAKYDQAIPYFEYAIRKLPNYYPSYDKLSFIFYSRKQYRESIAVNKLAIRNIPNTVEPYINIARTFVAANQTDSAKYYALEAYRIAPQNELVNQAVRSLGITR